MIHLRTVATISLACTLAGACGVHSTTLAPTVPSNTIVGNTIVGSGNVITEPRPVSGFTAISVSLPARVVVVQSGVEALSVTAEDNLMPLLRTEVQGGRLVIGLAPGSSITTTREIVLQVAARSLSAVEASGAARLELSRLDADDFSLQISGASEVTGSGTARMLRLDLTGDVRCTLTALSSRSAVAHLSGVTYAGLRVADSLTGGASGASVVEYYGDPVVSLDVSGLSTVRRVGP